MKIDSTISWYFESTWTDITGFAYLQHIILRYGQLLHLYSRLMTPSSTTLNPTSNSTSCCYCVMIVWHVISSYDLIVWFCVMILWHRVLLYACMTLCNALGIYAVIVTKIFLNPFVHIPSGMAEHDSSGKEDSARFPFMSWCLRCGHQSRSKRYRQAFRSLSRAARAALRLLWYRLRLGGLRTTCECKGCLQTPPARS